MGQVTGYPMPTSGISAAPADGSPQQQCQSLQEMTHRRLADVSVSIKALFTGIVYIIQTIASILLACI